MKRLGPCVLWIYLWRRWVSEYTASHNPGCSRYSSLYQPDKQPCQGQVKVRLWIQQQRLKQREKSEGMHATVKGILPESPLSAPAEVSVEYCSQSVLLCCPASHWFLYYGGEMWVRRVDLHCILGHGKQIDSKLPVTIYMCISLCLLHNILCMYM